MDIFIESSKGGQWAKWGLTDEVLWEVNPALVIVHVSGFGQEGDPAYIKRASWDGVGLAFGTITNLNGFPDEPLPVGPYLCDAQTALYASWGALAAYYRALQTGKGESLDIAQFEVMLRGQSSGPYRYFQGQPEPKRLGNNDKTACGFRNYKCSDGFIFIGLAGPSVLPKGLAFLGLEFGSELFPANQAWCPAGSEGGKLLDAKLDEFCAERTVLQAEKELLAAGIPCAAIMDYEMAANNSHYNARNVFVEWQHRDGRTVKGVNCIPKMKNNPGKVWKAAPGWGEDNEDILGELGYSPEEIAELYEKKIINKE